MKKVLIPRRDHEVYFFSRPETLKTKQLRHFVLEQLDKLHPAFSEEAAMDYRQLNLKNKHWIMATVMQNEILAEYKILHNGARFFTNTSIAVSGRDFERGGIKTIDDELIGYDDDDNKPVSVPNDSLPNAPAGLAESACAKNRLKKASAKYSVFAAKKPAWPIASAIAGIAMLLLIPPIFLFAPKKTAQAQTPLVILPETAEEQRYLPHAIEMLAAFSNELVKAGGKVSRWYYNEDTDPLLKIEMRGLGALDAYKIFAQNEYLSLKDIQDVKYIGGEPFFTINLNPADSEYLFLPSSSFPPLDISLPVFSALTGNFKKRNISIASETLPAADRAFYSVAFSSSGRNIVQALETLAETCAKNNLKVKSLDLSLSENRFSALCSLSYLDAAGQITGAFADGKKIPEAFGYKEPPPVAAAVKAPEKKQQLAIFGTIRDTSGQVLFYRDLDDGKIKVMGDS